MQGYGSYYRNNPPGMLSKTLSEFRVAGLRDSAAPPPVRVYRVNPDGTKGDLIRVEPGKTFEEARTRSAYNWGDLVHMQESSGTIIVKG